MCVCVCACVCMHVCKCVCVCVMGMGVIQVCIGWTDVAHTSSVYVEVQSCKVCYVELNKCVQITCLYPASKNVL